MIRWLDYPSFTLAPVFSPFVLKVWPGSELGYDSTKEQCPILSSRVTASRVKSSSTRFFENANVGATQLDPSGRFIAVNDRFSQITGYTREELLAGMTPLDLSYPDDRERDREHLMPFVEGKTSPYQVEKRYVRKDGQVIWVKITGGAVRDTDGRVVRTAGIIEDITARKNTEAELDALRRRLGADLNSMVRLHQISTKFFREADLRALLEESLETAIDITGADMGKIQLFDEASSTLKMMVHRGFDQRFLNFFATIGVGRAACGEAARRRERVVVENIAESPIFIGTPELDVYAGGGRQGHSVNAAHQPIGPPRWSTFNSLPGDLPSRRAKPAPPGRSGPSGDRSHRGATSSRSLA